MLQSIIVILYNFKRITSLILICLNLFFLFSKELFSQEPYRLRRVVIDPGHGGRDPGAVGARSKEKDIVLAIALKLGNYIEENHKDVEVIYTRTEDVFVELFKRADIANSNNADLFISIHANASPNRNVFGTETFAMGLHTSKENLEVARKENKAILFENDYTIRYEGYDPNSPESFIIFSLMQNTFLSQSLDFASHVQNQFRERARRYDRGVKQAGFLVLWRTTMPSVLIEVGFISNPEEENFMRSSEGQEYLASSIYRAFRDYKASIEQKSTGTGQHLIVRDTSSEQTQSVQNQTADGTDEIIFRIQVSASSNPRKLDSDFFRGMEHVSEYFFGGIYRYTVGQVNSHAEAIELRRKIRRQFPDAFIVASYRGKLISVKEALNHLNK